MPLRVQHHRKDRLVARGLTGCAVDRLGHLVGGRGHGRDEEDDDCVDLRVAQEERQRRRVGLRSGAAEHVDRIVDAGLRRQELGESGARFIGELGQCEAGGLAGVGAEDSQSAGVGQHGDASTL